MDKKVEIEYKDGHSVDGETIKRLKDGLETEEEIYLLSNMFKALSDPTRLNIICILSKSPLCVHDISNVLDMSQSSISHHLKVLRDTRLVKFRKEGKLVIYSIDDSHVLSLFKEGLDHIKHR